MPDMSPEIQDTRSKAAHHQNAHQHPQQNITTHSSPQSTILKITVFHILPHLIILLVPYYSIFILYFSISNYTYFLTYLLITIKIQTNCINNNYNLSNLIIQLPL